MEDGFVVVSSLYRIDFRKSIRYTKKKAITMVKILKALLKERSLSLTKLAKLAGHRPATVMAIENGSSDPRLRTVLDLCVQIPCSLRTFASCLGHDVSKIPLDCEIDSIVGLAEFAKARKTSLKEALKSLGIDVTGIPDD